MLTPGEQGIQAAKADDALRGAIRKYLDESYKLESGHRVKGQSVSFLQRCLRDDGWRNLGSCLYDFERMVEGLGFGLAEGRNWRGNRANVVFER